MLERASFGRVQEVVARYTHHESQPRTRFSKDWTLEALVSLRERGIASADARTIHKEIGALYHPSFKDRLLNEGGVVTLGQVGRMLNSMLLEGEIVSETVPDSARR